MSGMPYMIKCRPLLFSFIASEENSCSSETTEDSSRVMNRNHNCRARFLELALVLFVAHSSVGQQANAASPQPAIIPPSPTIPQLAIPPSPINSTYVIRESISGVRTVHLYEGNGQLTRDETTKTSGMMSDSVKYENVNYVAAEENSLDHNRKTTVRVEASDGFLIVSFRTEMEAKAVADYVGRKCSLEFFGSAWRVRRPFQCPSDVGPTACQSFKELLDHDDQEIVVFYYAQDKHEHRYVCFSEDWTRFFLIRYSNYGHFGEFYQEAFEDGQFVRGNAGNINWIGDSGTISTLGSKGPQQSGTVDASSFLYQDEFTNRMGTSTEYRLSFRLSTGRYTESSSGKDNKGKPFYLDTSGTCTKLN